MKKICSMVITVFFLLIVAKTFAHADDVCERLLPVSLKNALSEEFPSYRIATSADQCIEDDKQWNKLYCNVKRCLTAVGGDFNGDKKKDYAIFMASKAASAPILIAALRRGKKWEISEMPHWNQSILGCYVDKTEPGLYVRTESDDRSDLYVNERERIKARNVSIVAGTVESTGVVYVYEKGKWLYVWVSS